MTTASSPMSASTEYPRGWTAYTSGASGAKPSIIIPGSGFDATKTAIRHVLTTINATLQNATAAGGSTYITVTSGGVQLLIPGALILYGGAVGTATSASWTGQLPAGPGLDLTVAFNNGIAGCLLDLDIAGYDT